MTKGGHYADIITPTGETPFKRRFAGGPIMVRVVMLNGSKCSLKSQMPNSDCNIVLFDLAQMI